MVGIKDVAKKAGVSISTVSYALNNNDSRVSEATKKRILKIAEEMDYVPNMAGRTLKRKKTDVIGIYITSYKGYFYGSLISGMEKELNKHNYEIIICSGLKTHAFLAEKMIDGAIILDSKFEDEEIVKLANVGHSIVVLDRELNNNKISEVLLDNEKGAGEATNHLLSTSPDYFYIVTGPKNNYDSKNRLKAAEIVLSKSNQHYTIIEGEYDKKSGFQAALDIKIEKGKITAVFCFNDEMAIGVYEYISKTNFVIGEDVLIVGYDNTEIIQYTSPKLPSVDYSMFEWGEEAAKSLLSLLINGTTTNKKIKTTFVNSHLLA